MRTGSSFDLYGHPQLVPIARDICGECLVLDHRPETDRVRVHTAEAVGGVVRQPHAMWASLPALLEMTAASLETNRPLASHTPVVTEDQRRSVPGAETTT
ncbi:hypothetical protein ACGFXC_26870 [Streptomyces sp. NPDC048507]|uniref:hypothetical protein n=1 Tax=Streptomyces sp. NPDC048507 TaxID=3365560 RepID=UPI003717D6FF